MQNINDAFNCIPMHVITFSYGCPLPNILAINPLRSTKRQRYSALSVKYLYIRKLITQTYL